VIYSKFISFSMTDILNNLKVSLNTDDIIHSSSVALMAMWISALFWLTQSSRSNAPKRDAVIKISGICFTALAVLLTNPRGTRAFHDSPFVLTNIALFALAGGVILQRIYDRHTLAAAATAMALVLGAAAPAIWLEKCTECFPIDGAIDRDISHYAAEIKRDESDIYRYIRSITRKEGDLLALVLNPIIYIKAERLPASGHHFYLPWQAAYSRNPIQGYRIDICDDIKRNNPAVVWLFNLRVWERYTLQNYEPCVIRAINDGYTPLAFDSPWYIRNDVLRNSHVRPPRTTYPSTLDISFLKRAITQPSPQLSTVQPIPIFMTPEHKERPVALKRLGILFTTSGKATQGRAELRLTDPAGSKTILLINLAEISNSGYHFFDLLPKRYVAGDIVATAGGGISTLEDHLDPYHTYTCMLYEYVDGSRDYTTECPLK
jgi:hypothetical protein